MDSCTLINCGFGIADYGLLNRMNSNMLNNPQSEFRNPQFSRRELFSWSAFGLGATALSALLSRDRLANAAGIPGDAADPPPHLPAKAKNVIHICCCGGYSQ